MSIKERKYPGLPPETWDEAQRTILLGDRGWYPFRRGLLELMAQAPRVALSSPPVISSWLPRPDRAQRWTPMYHTPRTLEWVTPFPEPAEPVFQGHSRGRTVSFSAPLTPTLHTMFTRRPLFSHGLDFVFTTTQNRPFTCSVPLIFVRQFVAFLIRQLGGSHAHP